MKNSLNIALIVIVVLLIGLNVYKKSSGGDADSSAPSVTAGPVNAEGFSTIEIDGSPVKKLEKYDENNVLIESGETLNDLKTGTWTTYYTDGRVKSISSYIAGKLNGVQVNFTDRGQVELQAFYKDGILHGSWTSYNNGSRKKEERMYNMGKLDGINRHYNRVGKLQKEIGFKNDLQHGVFKYYDDDGNVTLEYEYENGEKVKGGIVSE